MSIYLRPLLVGFMIAFMAVSGLSQTMHAVAKPNETVWVIAYPVKASKRAQYERFIHEIFWPGAKNLSAADQKILNKPALCIPPNQKPMVRTLICSLWTP